MTLSVIRNLITWRLAPQKRHTLQAPRKSVIRWLLKIWSRFDATVAMLGCIRGHGIWAAKAVGDVRAPPADACQQEPERLQWEPTVDFGLNRYRFTCPMHFTVGLLSSERKRVLTISGLGHLNTFPCVVVPYRLNKWIHNTVCFAPFHKNHNEQREDYNSHSFITNKRRRIISKQSFITEFTTIWSNFHQTIFIPSKHFSMMFTHK